MTHAEALPETATGAPDTALNTDMTQGLSAAEAAERLKQYGPNALEEKHETLLDRLKHFFWGPIPWMIEIAAILSAVLGDWPDFAIILAMLLINAAVDWWQERKAGDAIASLKAQLALSARVLRDGAWTDVPAAELVPGDVVHLKLGDITPADVRLVSGSYLTADESALTGESLPAEKKPGDTAYSGATIRMGEMGGVVSATGMQTFFGKTARMVENAETKSHFQKAVLGIGNFLILVTIALVAVILVTAVIRGTPFWDTLQFALILTVAAIPVALPTVLSVTMAVGAEKLAKLKAIVSRLVSIEELAGVDVACVDKTGTLTMNQLTLAELKPEAGVEEAALLRAARMACNAEDPDAIDSAILADAPPETGTLLEFTPFDPVSKRASARMRLEEGEVSFSKGAPQVILDLCALPEAERTRIEQAVDALAADGYRALGAAEQKAGGAWTFLGLIPIFDPPREDAAETIATLRRMGLRIKMITGDHEAIARQIAGRLGLGADIGSAGRMFDGTEAQVAERIDAADGVARVLPEHKFAIVKALQGKGHIVAMTGDGVNDAPALKQADAGIAVSGATDAARAAADVVLTGTGLSVIAAAVEESRRIFERMLSYATFRISETIRVLIFTTLSILVFNFYPVTAVMIVLLALLNDFPIMMIAYDNTRVADRPVRWQMKRVLTLATCLGLTGVLETFLLFWFADAVLKLPRDTIQSIIFLKLLVAGHFTLYITRSEKWVWTRPWPSLRLFLTTETTQVLGTLFAVYGVLIAPIGWGWALAVWAYALCWLVIENFVAIAVRRWLARGDGQTA
ncbi:plasma-membrane proton-efflux P-type ATPase [Pseudooceanicola sp. CBS1P-1]|uniref:Plasma-membrane proton-efflux P-type ATPase n=1 Tax=Pseudooceanicola albus TaxID=2692189 RepID=A0A6L7G0A3_9RHOB|nr:MULTISPECIES: plasma-membrane proton-efflux P-type ATPase [Pseudooceanicola]MBT9383667.1 plasma-membrane proton-efflux P-type ATPase [Pseudooceanicola endophyticus]MXN17521.1 plasma-membrane proton-efflux P-type ATPase [Pseudooceanicola albus]